MEGLNENLIQQMIIFSGVLAVLVVALNEVVKRTFEKFPKNYIPLLSVLFGVIIGALAFSFTDLDLTVRLWSGLIAGLSAVGLFEATDKILKR